MKITYTNKAVKFKDLKVGDTFIDPKFRSKFLMKIEKV